MGDPLKTGFTRVFLIEGRARADREPDYQSAMKMTGLDYGLGDVTPIRVPDPANFDKFKTVGEVRGEEDRPSTSLVGRYAIDVRSELLRLAKIGCAADVQLHMGACTAPNIFNEFQKVIVLEDVLLSNFGTDDLGALEPGERAVVNETGDISAAEIYEVLPVSTQGVADDLMTAEGVDVIFGDSVSCGDCDEYSDGCQKIFILALGTSGSPGVAAGVVFSLDKGSTWYQNDVDSMTNPGDIASGIALVAGNIVVVSIDTCSLHYADVDDFDGVTDPEFLEVATGFDVSGCPNDIWSIGHKAFVVGEGGYIYLLTDPTAGVEELDNGSASGSDDLLAVHALDEDYAVAVGNNGAVVYTVNGTLWSAAGSRPVGAGVNLNCVWMRGQKEWWVGTSNGRLYVTYNQGETWAEKTFTGSGAGVVWDIAFPKDSVGFMAHATAADAGRIFRSYNAGYSWQIIPEGSGVMPANDRVTALAACTNDPNVACGAGLADDGTDGFAVMAS